MSKRKRLSIISGGNISGLCCRAVSQMLVVVVATNQTRTWKIWQSLLLILLSSSVSRSLFSPAVIVCREFRYVGGETRIATQWAGGVVVVKGRMITTRSCGHEAEDNISRWFYEQLDNVMYLSFGTCGINGPWVIYWKHRIIDFK